MQIPYPFFPATFEIPDDWIAEAGVVLPLSGTSYASAGATLVPVDEIEPPVRNLTHPLDFRGFDRARLVNLLAGMRDGVELPPVRLARVDGPDFPPARFHFRVIDGFHRYHASLAAGFAQLPATFGMTLPTVTMQQAELARELSSDAAAYFQTARKVTSGEGPMTMLATYYKPVNFLLAHCCELALKAQLVGRGFAIERLATEIGHDLDAAIDEARVWGIPLDPEFVRYCRIMAPAHRDYVWRYAERGTSHWVDPAQALELIRPQLEQLVPREWLR